MIKSRDFWRLLIEPVWEDYFNNTILKLSQTPPDFSPVFVKSRGDLTYFLNFD